MSSNALRTETHHAPSSCPIPAPFPRIHADRTGRLDRIAGHFDPGSHSRNERIALGVAAGQCHPCRHRSPRSGAVGGHSLVATRCYVQQPGWSRLRTQLNKGLENRVAGVSGPERQRSIRLDRQTDCRISGNRWCSHHPGQCIDPAIRVHAHWDDGIWNGHP